MLSRIHKTTLLTAAALALAMVAQAAGASMITQWDYTILSGFSNAQDSDGNPIEFASSDTMSHSGQGSGYDGDYTKISATDTGGEFGGNVSSVSIDGTVSGSNLFTNTSGVAGATFTHENHVLSLRTNDLSSFFVDTRLLLTATAPPSEDGQEASPIPSLTFLSNFIETDNTVGASNCAVQDNGPACSDIFVLGNAGTLSGALNGSGDFVISQDFTAGTDNRAYTLFLTINGLGLLDDAVCTAADAAVDCIGFTTSENATNKFTTNLRIVSAVPAPGTLSIFGLGMLCLIIGGGLSRKRRAGKHLSV